jgi:hypothetical protein
MIVRWTNTMLWSPKFRKFRRSVSLRAAQFLVASCTLVPLAGAHAAECVPFNQRIPADNLDMFRTEPTSILNNVGKDNAKIAGRIAGYVETDPKLLDTVRKLVAVAPTEIKPAIGTGLRRAALQCTTAQQPQATRDIEKFIRDLGDHAVSAGYVAVTEQPELDATVGMTTGSQSAGSSQQPGSPLQARSQKQDPGSLLSGEYSTKLSDPFEKVPLPLMPDTPNTKPE